MKLYSCKLRLAGSVANELRKENVTAAEIEVLRAFHGGDAVVEIVETGDAKRSSREERARLYGIYASPAHNMPEAVDKKTRRIRDIFGHDSLPLPEEVVEQQADAEDDGTVLEAAPAPAKERTPAFAE